MRLLRNTLIFIVLFVTVIIGVSIVGHKMRVDIYNQYTSVYEEPDAEKNQQYNTNDKKETTDTNADIVDTDNGANEEADTTDDSQSEVAIEETGKETEQDKDEKIKTESELLKILEKKAGGLEMNFTVVFDQGVDAKAIIEDLDDNHIWNTTQFKYSYAIYPESTPVDFELMYSGEFAALMAAQNEELLPQLTSNDRDLLNKAKDILGDIIKPGMTDYEKELAIHDYIVTNSRYDERVGTSGMPDSSYTAYGLLLNGTAVCDGYAKVMYLLLSLAGVECLYISGKGTDVDGRTELHAWNMVRLDGEWYHLDATWNDPMPDSGGVVHYEYFNVDDTRMTQNHTWNRELYPKSTGKKYAYYTYNSRVAENYTQFKEIVETETTKAQENGNSYIQLFVTNYSKDEYSLDFLQPILDSGVRILYYEPSGRSGEYMIVFSDE